MKEKLKDYLNSIYQNSQTGKQSISDLLNDVQSGELKQELENQLKGYDLIGKECEKFAIDNDIEIKDNNWLEKAKMWTSVKMSILTDKSTRHMAEMLLVGTVMGLNVCYKDRWDYRNTDEKLDEILSKLEVLEEENYKNLKHFLKGDLNLLDKQHKEDCGCGKEDCACHDEKHCGCGEEICGCNEDNGCDCKDCDCGDDCNCNE